MASKPSYIVPKFDGWTPTITYLPNGMTVEEIDDLMKEEYDAEPVHSVFMYRLYETPQKQCFIVLNDEAPALFSFHANLKLKEKE